jgi:flagellar FliJ protein
MKKYVFRLEPVLKVRRLKEENCRMELGQLITYLSRIDAQIDRDRGEIENYYRIQEESMRSGARAHQLQAFPMLVAGKERNLQLLQQEKRKQEELIEEKKRELAALKGDLKVIENLKEKDYNEYRKALNKEIDQKVEEQTQNWLQFRDRKV